MRLKKGSRVEVLRFNETSFGAWRSAEIISGNGRMYNVRYYAFSLANNGTMEEKVPRKLIRPCPPQIDVDRWEAGDLVDVLDNISWKTAMVLEELPGRYYLVQLLGAVAELKVHKFDLRARSCWQDERWVTIEINIKPILNNNRVPQETSVASLKMLKRPSPCDWYESAESCTGSPKKIRSMDEGHQHQFASTATFYPETKGGKRRVQASIHNSRKGFRKMVRSKRFSECVGTRNTVSNGCYDTDACSVGSCSPISYDENDMPISFLNGSSHDAKSNRDAESSKEAFGCREEARRNHSLAGGGAGRFCRTELYTYRSTLSKLFASGPLNWDQEASLTDLRLSLNISSDEHSMELRNLISAGRQSKFVSNNQDSLFCF